MKQYIEYQDRVVIVAFLCRMNTTYCNNATSIELYFSLDQNYVISELGVFKLIERPLDQPSNEIYSIENYWICTSHKKFNRNWIHSLTIASHFIVLRIILYTLSQYACL